MNEEGLNIFGAIHQARNIFKDVALLLRTADETLGSQGWEPTGNTAFEGSSISVLNPERWMPHYISRFTRKCRKMYD